MNRRHFIGMAAGGIITANHAGTSGTDAPDVPSSSASFPSPFVSCHTRRGGLGIRVDSPRVLMRGPMFPNLARFRDGSIILFAQAVEEGGPLAAIRSEDNGATWRGHPAGVDGLGLNTFQPTAGPALSIHYDTKSVEGSDGLRTTKRWESDDGWHTLRGPLEDGTLALPPDQFKTEEKQWFHGNTLELPDGRLLAGDPSAVGVPDLSGRIFRPGENLGFSEPHRFPGHIGRSGRRHKKRLESLGAL